MAPRKVAELTQGGISVAICNAEGDDYLDGYSHRPVEFTNGSQMHGQECFIPATQGQGFSIRISYNKDDPEGSMIDGAGLQAEVLLEGAAWIVDVHWPATKLEEGSCEFEITSFPVKLGICSFRFGQRVVTDEPVECKEIEPWWLGTVCVRVYWAAQNEAQETPDRVEEQDVERQLLQEDSARILNEPLDERDKDIQHELCIEYAPDKAQAAPKSQEPGAEPEYDVTKVGTEEYHFVFRYRRIEWLVAEEIAPRSRLPARQDRELLTPSSSLIKREEPSSEPPKRKTS
ncbi:hypothetical protein FRC12_010823 [Ceratobasidium sp. 428]|nr:hypothetical protein FRC12_010823 [Ceratobasidium sp. 428]